MQNDEASLPVCPSALSTPPPSFACCPTVVVTLCISRRYRATARGLWPLVDLHSAEKFTEVTAVPSLRSGVTQLHGKRSVNTLIFIQTFYIEAALTLFNYQLVPFTAQILIQIFPSYISFRRLKHFPYIFHLIRNNVCETDDLKLPLVGAKEEINQISAILLVTRA